MFIVTRRCPLFSFSRISQKIITPPKQKTTPNHSESPVDAFIPRKTVHNHKSIHQYQCTLSIADIPWYKTHNMWCLQFSAPNTHMFFVSDKMTFKTLQIPYQMLNIQLEFPLGVNQNTSILQFLLQSQKPQTIKIRLADSEYQLHNQASITKSELQSFSQNYFHAMTQVFQDPNNIYAYIDNKVEAGFDQSHAPLLAYFEMYFKKELSTMGPDAVITKEKKKEIMAKIMGRFRVDSKQKIWDLQLEQLKNDIRIDEINKEIKAFNNALEHKFSWYVKAVSVLSGLHIVTFGYMIFFVDWLGWDIIEPLTYSLGLVTSILAMRFYLRHKQERNIMAVRDTLKRILTKNSDQVWLEQKIRKRQFYLDERERIKQRIDIYHMRADFGWFRELNNPDELPKWPQEANTP